MMKTVLTDERALLSAARQGDRGAFGSLVREYQRRAYAAAYSLVGNRDDALELSQDAFVRAFKAMDRFELDRPFYPWLYRIIKNTCFNHLKKKKRRGESSLDSMMEKGYDARDAGPGPRQAAAQSGLQSCIREAMDALSKEHQEILRLRHFLEFSYAEIAEQLNVPQGTVMSRLHGARKALRNVLERNGADIESFAPGAIRS
jgi:RNA polymerase sigma-70 factor, ECF subfamily